MSVLSFAVSTILSSSRLTPKKIQSSHRTEKPELIAQRRTTVDHNLVYPATQIKDKTYIADDAFRSNCWLQNIQGQHLLIDHCKQPQRIISSQFVPDSNGDQSELSTGIQIGRSSYIPYNQLKLYKPSEGNAEAIWEIPSKFIKSPTMPLRKGIPMVGETITFTASGAQGKIEKIVDGSLYIAVTKGDVCVNDSNSAVLNSKGNVVGLVMSTEDGNTYWTPDNRQCSKKQIARKI